MGTEMAQEFKKSNPIKLRSNRIRVHFVIKLQIFDII